MSKRKLLGYILLLLVALVFYHTLRLLTDDVFKAYRLVYAISFLMLLLHGYFVWVLMAFSRRANRFLNAFGQIFNLIAGVFSFALFLSSDYVDLYWNWSLALLVIGGGISMIFLAGAYEEKFRILPWISTFVITFWVLYTIYVLMEKVSSIMFFELMLFGWLFLLLITVYSIVTRPKL